MRSGYTQNKKNMHDKTFSSEMGTESIQTKEKFDKGFGNLWDCDIFFGCGLRPCH